MIHKNMQKWLFYNLTIGFALYWTGNIILWYPWSVNANLGIAMMLTIMPLFWGFGIYFCLIRFNGKNILVGSALTSLTMLVSSIILDYIFLGLIRGAMKDLYQPTTFYGYAFLITIPFIELLFFRKLIIKNKRQIKTNDFILVGMIGAICLLTLIAIIKFDIKL